MRKFFSIGNGHNFCLERAIEMGGIFPQEAVSTLCRLAGWSEGSGVWSMYVKDVFERFIDTSRLLYSYEKKRIPNIGSITLSSKFYLLAYLNITTAYNFRLILPNTSLQTYEDYMEHEEFGDVFSSYKDKWLGCTMAEAKEGMKRVGE